MTSETRYPVGTKIMVEMKITDIDSSVYPYFVEAVDENVDISAWLSEDQLQSLNENVNPELKRQRIQSEIDKLQKELEELNNGCTGAGWLGAVTTGAGVDNWEGWDEAMAIYEEQKDMQ